MKSFYIHKRMVQVITFALMQVNVDFFNLVYL